MRSVPPISYMAAAGAEARYQDSDQVRQLKQLQKENERLKKIVAELCAPIRRGAWTLSSTSLPMEPGFAA